ncbi:nitrogen regulation protein NR(I) [Aliidiomarina sanyensis]|uniref:DNA-binding transcriptional regulator NtrC n=1 Tax=Aliidiomarina sanyensis TaxID=1249555 RepID=A0A432WG49_9GAMM|nr:nitrogen regulation protein NR(I) [Aliidiomarina sanyensis]RUO32733.1 nitrogen regulation protein NR(I) [Aliidiomarina sanyensis]
MSRTVWILDDDSSIRWVLERAFSAAGWTPRMFSEPQSFLDTLTTVAREQTPDLVLTDVRMPGMDGMDVLERLQQRLPNLPVVVMTAHSDLASAVNAFKGGAFEYLPKPFDLDEVIAVAERATKAQGEASPASDVPVTETGIIGESPAMQEVFRAIGRLSRSSVTVLLTGASGTGKELVARALHQHSPRAQAPFVALNMAAIPSELIESELFGHEKGAFTGATTRRDGRFQQANGGTLFLDEIGDMPLAVQTRLLRALAEGQFYPVGSHQLVTVDVRVIAATHIDLRKAIAEGRFREDLYHRLNVIHVRLPTLEERRSDIPALAEHFLHQAAEELKMPRKRLTEQALKALQKAPWPGNVRQLENLCRWVTVMASSDWVDQDELPSLASLHDDNPVHSEVPSAAQSWQSVMSETLREKLAEGVPFTDIQDMLEQMAVAIALEQTGGHRQQAAERLGWGRNTLTRKLQRWETAPENPLTSEKPAAKPEK